MTFLESFLSEFRTFKRIPNSWQTKNALWEIEKTEMIPETIVGILMEKKQNKFMQSQVENALNFNQTTRVFRYKKGVVLNRDDIIDDNGDQYRVVLKPKKVIVFGGVYDHNVASLVLIE
jgi:hypothetical protein